MITIPKALIVDLADSDEVVHHTCVAVVGSDFVVDNARMDSAAVGSDFVFDSARMDAGAVVSDFVVDSDCVNDAAEVLFEPVGACGFSDTCRV